MREVENLKLLQNCNGPVMKLIDYFSLDIDGEENYFIVVEFIEGLTLDDWYISYSQGMSISEIVRDIFLPIAEVIRCMHSQNVIHRDLTVKNIIVRKKNGGFEPIIIDWNAGKQVKDPYDLSAGAKKGTVIFTPGFFPPEIALGQNPTAHSDIYMLGVLLNFLLTGQRRIDPAVDPSGISGGLDKNLFELDPGLYNPNIPQSFREIVKKATKFDRASRYQSVDEMISDIKQALAGASIRAAVPQQIKFRYIPILEVLTNGGIIEIRDIYTRIGREDIVNAEKVILSNLDPAIYKIVTRRNVDPNREQFIIQYYQGQYYIMDRNSSNGTIVDGVNIQGRGWYPLKNGSQIVIKSEDGKAVIRLVFKIIAIPENIAPV